MDMSTSAMASMATSMSMSMVFSNAQTTPLLSSAWAPNSAGTYAGTCIFLIVLSIIARLLSAYRSTLEQRWHSRAVARRYVFVAEEQGAAGNNVANYVAEKSDEAVLTTRGINEKVRVLRTPRQSVQGMPWRFSTDLPRACIFTVQAGVGYLLMLAVMTLNIGYFLSVLAGLFLGELAVGRYTNPDDGHH